MDRWMNDHWPLEYLLPEVRNRLADALDVVTARGLGYPTFAAALRIDNRAVYSAQYIELIRVRSQPGSPTLALLLDYEIRGGSIQGVQRALERIGHVASQIIPAYYGYFAAQTFQDRSPNSGFQNTEATPCNCPTCQGQNQSINSNRRPNSQMREENVLSGSVNTGSPRSRKTVRQRSRTSRSSVPDTGSNNLPSGPGFVDEARNQASIRRELCPCEECRLRSDPEQTRRLTLESDPKIKCSVQKGPLEDISKKDLMGGSVNDAERLESGLSQLYLDSYESEENSVQGSAETYVKSVVGESQRSNSKQRENFTHNYGMELCSRSDIRQHRLGEMPEDCPGCRQHTGARPKDRSRAADRNDQQDTTLRQSWHGTSENKSEEELLKSWSDSSLTFSRHSGTNMHQGDERNVIRETLYSRISSGSGSSRNAETSFIGHGSIQDIYRNNLDTDVEAISAVETRNIVPSDSSNFTDNENTLADSSTRTRNNSQSSLNSLVFATNAQSDNAPQRRQPARNGRQKPKVFVTYGWNGNVDSESFIQELIDMCLALRDKDIRTKIDMDDNSYSSLMLNKLDWIDKNVREAMYIIVCITPTYAADIREPDQRNPAAPRASQLNARYIYDKLREEYYSNMAQNRRIIPVIFSNHRATHVHVPDCMRSTLIYEYPNDIEKIIAAILGHGRFRPS